MLLNIDKIIKMTKHKVNVTLYYKLLKIYTNDIYKHNKIEIVRLSTLVKIMIKYYKKRLMLIL